MSNSASEVDSDDWGEVPTMHVGNVDNDESSSSYKLSYRTAREYFHTLQPRKITDKTQPSQYRISRPGELIGEDGETATTIDPFLAKSEYFNGFGIGVSLYFRTVKGLFIIFITCACILIIAMSKNNDDQYPKYNSDELILPVNMTYPVETPVRLLGSVYGARRSGLKFDKQVAADIAICCILLIFSFVSEFVEEKEIEDIDLSQQTSQDYTVVITNPPPNYSDPQVRLIIK